MRWPESTRRKRWPIIFLTLEYIAALSRTFGIALCVLLTLFELKNWLESGNWVFIPVQVLLTDVLHIPLFKELQSWYTDPTSWYNTPGTWKGAHTIVALFLQKFPLSIFLLSVGKLISIYIYWFIDNVFPEKKEVTKGFKQAGRSFINFK